MRLTILVFIVISCCLHASLHSMDLVPTTSDPSAQECIQRMRQLVDQLTSDVQSLGQTAQIPVLKSTRTYLPTCLSALAAALGTATLNEMASTSFPTKTLSGLLGLSCMTCTMVKILASAGIPAAVAIVAVIAYNRLSARKRLTEQQHIIQTTVESAVATRIGSIVKRQSDLESNLRASLTTERRDRLIEQVETRSQAGYIRNIQEKLQEQLALLKQSTTVEGQKMHDSLFEIHQQLESMHAQINDTERALRDDVLPAVKKVGQVNDMIETQQLPKILDKIREMSQLVQILESHMAAARPEPQGCGILRKR